MAKVRKHPGDVDREYIEGLEGYDDQLEHWRELPEKNAELTDPRKHLSREVAERFREKYGKLYSHQAEALSLTDEGKNVCVSTSTSSGKTYIYALQIAKNQLESSDSTALIVYPTRALSKDQERELNDFYSNLGLDIDVQVYDGDTSSTAKKRIRKNADVIITNFSGVNVYLSHHHLWDRIYRNCELVVIDESHSYTGVHGMHVAWVVRRLRRVIETYGGNPGFITTSATIGNPREHCRNLVGADFDIVDDDGSPRGRRYIGFWNPNFAEMEDQGGDEKKSPQEVLEDLDLEDLEDNDEEKGSDGGDGVDGDRYLIQGGSLREGSALLAHLAKRNMQTLMFSRSRKSTELASKYAKQEITDQNSRGTAVFQPYHAGLGKQTRVSVENKIKNHEIDGIVSTNALELGIDIGSVDATILSGYPGTRQSFWQQLGRSGRGKSDSLTLFLANQDGIDQYIMDNPDYVLEDSVEGAVVDLSNNSVYSKHVLAAAEEKPLIEADKDWLGGDRLEDAVDMWRKAGVIEGDLEVGARYTGEQQPQMDVSMYSVSDDQYYLECKNGDIDCEPLDESRVHMDYYPGALFLHNGEQYEVLEVDEEEYHNQVFVRSVQTNHYTTAKSDKYVKDLDSEEATEFDGGFRMDWGDGTVIKSYDKAIKREIRTDDLVDTFPIELDSFKLETKTMWIKVPLDMYVDGFVDRFHFSREAVEESLEAPIDIEDDPVANKLAGGLHAAEHGLIKMTPLELMMDTSDLGGLSTLHHKAVGGPAIFIHDTAEGGVGFSKGIFENLESVAERSFERLDNCSCGKKVGCPACTMSSDCGNQNEFLDREAGVLVLNLLLDCV